MTEKMADPENELHFNVLGQRMLLSLPEAATRSRPRCPSTAIELGVTKKSRVYNGSTRELLDFLFCKTTALGE